MNLHFEKILGIILLDFFSTSEMAHDELRQRENDDDETDENLVVCLPT